MTAAALSRRDQNRAEKRARITAAARALFSAKGFQATTTKEVARAAGVASGTIFTYAATKEDLLILVFHDEMLAVVSRSFERARSLPADDLVPRLMQFFSGLVDYHAADLDLARVLMRELGYMNADQPRALVDELMASIFGCLDELIEAARDSGALGAPCPVRSTARIVFATYYMHLGSWLNAVVERRRFEFLLREDLTTLINGQAATTSPSPHRQKSA